jgi:hypothetical protein
MKGLLFLGLVGAAIYGALVSKLVQTAMAMVSSTKIRTMNVNARHALALVLYLMTTTMKK